MPNNSLNRSANSVAFIRKTCRWLRFIAAVMPGVRWLRLIEAMGIFRISSFLLSVVLVASVPAQHLKRNEGRITGALLDARCKTGVAKAAITIRGTKLKRKLKSNTEGNFEISLPPGTYQITIEKYGFKRYIVNDVKVGADTEFPVTVHMNYGWSTDDPNHGKPEPCRATEQIVGRERRERVSHHNWCGDA
jgi:Carboxypeptidase regulatory-like domain